MDKFIEVLVVDNDENFATECVDFLKMTCNVEATFALTAKDAEEKLKVLPIKIVLLDYDMPVNGLDLFPRLHQIDSCIEFVFISAVASNKVLYEAEKYPFAAKISKAACFKELPELIPSLLMKYAKDSSKSSDVFFSEYKSRLLRRHKIEYSICSYNIINKEYIFPDSWHTTQMVHAGEKLEHREEIDYEKLFDFSDNFKVDFGADFGLNMEFNNSNFSTALSSKLENTIKSNYSERIKIAINRIREISLSTMKDDTNSSIVARYYDFANVYLEMKIRINKYCTCCNNNTILLTTAYFPIPKVAYRIRDYFDGKEPRIIDSGFYETGFSAARLV